MSQCFRLLKFYDGTTTDIITSGYNYLLQALGIAIFVYILDKKRSALYNNKAFVISLIIGALFMSIIQLSNSAFLIVVAGYAFNLLIGIYFGFYLTLFAQNVPKFHAGLLFGAAYAFGSVGTYLLSTINSGTFLESKEIIVIYFIILSLTIAFILKCKDIKLIEDTNKENPSYIKQFLLIVIIMSFISVLGSTLYFSLDITEKVNWNLIRAFYAFGLLLAGYLIDKNRFIGEIVVIASLVFPLVTTTLSTEGVTNTVVLSLNYIFRGFFTIYYIISFTSLYAEDKSLLKFAPIGLMLSRVVEAVISLLTLWFEIPKIVELLLASILFIPLLILYVTMQNNKNSSSSINDERRLAIFSEKYNLTPREMEIVLSLKEGLSDAEISDKYFISKNTVRFHISNILKKTNSKSRIDIVRLLNKS